MKKTAALLLTILLVSMLGGCYKSDVTFKFGTFDGVEITREEAVEAIHQGIIHGDIIPVICGSATNLWGVSNLLDAIVESFPRHTAKKEETVLVDGEEDIETIAFAQGEENGAEYIKLGEGFAAVTYTKVD